MDVTPPPHTDLAAERAVLGAVLADNQVMAQVSEVVVADHFSNLGHQQIFAAMQALDSRQETIDHLTVAEELKVRGHLMQVGGPTYLMSLDQAVPLAQNAVQYARIVKDKAARRALARAGREILELASQDVGEVDALLDDAQRKVLAIAENRKEGELRPMSELLPAALDVLDKMKKAGSSITGIATGYADLDNLLTGLHGGELIILAARPGIGKTSLAMNIATNVASKEQKPVAVFSLEMPAEQLVVRLLASAARVDMRKLRGGRIVGQDQEKIWEVANQMAQDKMYIDDTGALSSYDLRAKARRLKDKEPELSLIVIDYLQLMHQKGRVESRQLEIAEISRGLKQLAKELSVPIIALSQLNRTVEERKGGKPMLSDLRESGAIEQDADVVMFIHREDEGDEDGGGGGPKQGSYPVELIVAKQRNGPTDSVNLIFLAEFTRFESRARGDWS